MTTREGHGAGRAMRLAVVSTIGVPWGGSEELWAAMADAALSEGVALSIVGYRWPVVPARLAGLVQRGAQVVHRARPRIPGLDKILTRLMQRPIQLPAPFYRTPTVRKLAAFRPDHVCISQGNAYGVLEWGDLVHWLHTSRIPYTLVCQSNDDAPIPALLRRQAVPLFQRAARIVFVSQHNLASAERQLAVRLPHGVVVQNPVNLSDSQPVPWPAEEEICFASVARLEPHAKGHDILFAVLADPVWQTRNWRLRLYGDGYDKAYVQALIRLFNLSERVELCGQVPDVRAIWAANHILLMPSRFEGTPLALVEAMLCARPAVVTDVGGNAEWVEHGQNGFIAEAPTVASFGRALESAWQARTTWKALGQQAHQTATAKRDPAPGATLLRLLKD